MCWLCVCSPLPVIRRGCAPCRRQLFWLAGSILAYSFYDPRPQVLELLDQRQQILAVGDARRILDQRPMPLAAILFRPFVELLGHEEGVVGDGHHTLARCRLRSEEHTSELQSLMRISYAVFCLKKKTISNTKQALS